MSCLLDALSGMLFMGASQITDDFKRGVQEAGQNFFEYGWIISESSLQYTFIDSTAYRGVSWQSLAPSLRYVYSQVQFSV